MKDERLLEELKARLDIVDVISDYIELKRAGQNYKGLCPFHSEKTPSFMVNPGKQRFHCFGCGTGGDIIQFAMKYENLSFQETLKLLAKKAGIDLKDYKVSKDDEGLRGKLLEIVKEASRVFAENLRKSKSAYAYLRGRGLTEETIRAFSLGYAVKEWHSLTNYLVHKGFSLSLILQSGIASSGDRGSYDTFRDRILFPISDVQGDIIAFGGRVMDDSHPKYLNSAESPLFKKGETLYGLNYAKDSIRRKGYAIVVEGYLDVMMSHQYGFDNTVAPLGTALTTGHLQKMKRFARKAVLVFDSDEAGKSAAKRSLPLLLEQGFGAKILLLPDKEDPDSFLKKHGNVPYEKLLSESRSVIDFVLDSSRKDKTETVHEAIGIISAASDTIMKEELIAELARKTDMSEAVIREEMRNLSRKLKGKRSALVTSRSSPGPAFCHDEELLLLSAVIAFPEKLDSVLSRVSFEDFRDPAIRHIFEKLSAENTRKGFDAILSTLGDQEKTLVIGLTVNPGFDLENVDKNVEDCIKKKVMCRFETMNKQAHVKGDREELNALLLEKRRLIKEAR
ncbi:MAG TPA: DNA primase [Thermodesulfovibrionales bacterium]|nr:DNA primase [Thermodesulfovibrionales bacterium]